MTVKAEITSTLNGQSADLVLIEDGDSRSHEKKTLSGGTETLIFTGLDGGEDKEYTAKIVPSTSDVTQTSEVNFGATVDIDPIPHRDVDADVTIREDAEFNNGVSTKELGLGDHTLVGGLLTTALNDGEVLADDGYVYSTVQAAQDAASSWIFIGPGTFNENVTVDTPGLTVQGSGYNTLIDGTGTVAPAIDGNSANISVFDLRAKTDADRNIYATISLTGADSIAENVTVTEYGIYGVEATIVTNCRTSSNVTQGLFTAGIRASESGGIVTNCVIENANNVGIFSAFDDGIIVNNIVRASNNDNIRVTSADTLIGGNRSISAGSNGLRATGSDNIFFNNRVSDSTDSDISDSGTGTVLDGNNTGASN